MQELLNRRHSRRAFYVIVSLALLVIALLRGLALPLVDCSLWLTWPGFAALLLDTLFASLLVTVMIGTFLFWLTPEIVKRSAIEVVEPSQINHIS